MDCFRGEDSGCLSSFVFCIAPSLSRKKDADPGGTSVQNAIGDFPEGWWEGMARCLVSLSTDYLTSGILTYPAGDAEADPLG